MKNYFKSVSILLALVAVLLSACSDDDGSNTLAIVGVYTLTQESVAGCNDPADNVTENKSCSASDCETLVINGNGTFSVTEINNSVSTMTDGTYSLNGNQITFTYTENNVAKTDVATYTLNGGVLILTFAADTDGCVESDTYSKN